MIYIVTGNYELSGHHFTTGSIIEVLEEPSKDGSSHVKITLLKGNLTVVQGFTKQAIVVNPTFSFHMRTNRFKQFLDNRYAMIYNYFIF